MLIRLFGGVQRELISSQLPPLPRAPEPEILYSGTFEHAAYESRDIPFQVIQHKGQHPVLRVLVDRRRPAYLDLRTVYLLVTDWKYPRFMQSGNGYYLRDSDSRNGGTSLDVSHMNIGQVTAELSFARRAARISHAAISPAKYEYCRPHAI